MKVNLSYNLIFIKAYNDVLRDSSSSNLHVCLFQCPYETKLPISFIRTGFLYENVNTIVRLDPRPKCQNCALVQLNYYPNTLLLSQGGH